MSTIPTFHSKIVVIQCRLYVQFVRNEHKESKFILLLHKSFLFSFSSIIYVWNFSFQIYNCHVFTVILRSAIYTFLMKVSTQSHRDILTGSVHNFPHLMVFSLKRVLYLKIRNQSLSRVSLSFKFLFRRWFWICRIMKKIVLLSYPSTHKKPQHRSVRAFLQKCLPILYNTKFSVGTLFLHSFVNLQLSRKFSARNFLSFFISFL